MKINTIRENHLFTRTYKKGKTSVQKPLVVYFLKDSRRFTGLRVGLTVNKKLGGAVERNRVRRILREAFRTIVLAYPELQQSGGLMIIVARSAAFGSQVKTQDMTVALKRALENLGLV